MENENTQPTVKEEFGSNKEINQKLQTPELSSEIKQNFYQKQASKFDGFELKFISKFLTFLKQFGVVALALGVVVGQTVNKLVNSLVENIITPIINLLIPSNGKSFQGLEFFGIKYGAFISSLIEFVIVLLIIYIVVSFVVSKLLTDEEKKKLNIESKEAEEEIKS
jgi:large conductance mechanosensitive channel